MTGEGVKREIGVLLGKMKERRALFFLAQLIKKLN